MKTKICCLLFILIIGNKALSQGHLVSLHEQKIHLPNHSYCLTKVVDQRTDQANIGWVQKGITNTKVNASFSKPFEKEIQNFLNTHLGPEGLNLNKVSSTLF